MPLDSPTHTPPYTPRTATVTDRWRAWGTEPEGRWRGCHCGAPTATAAADLGDDTLLLQKEPPPVWGGPRSRLEPQQCRLTPRAALAPSANRPKLSHVYTTRDGTTLRGPGPSGRASLEFARHEDWQQRQTSSRETPMGQVSKLQREEHACLGGVGVPRRRRPPGREGSGGGVLSETA